ncbi:MAG: hypothetical protein K8S27_11395 [Candidatus Omnitrophica bacterium]|nr:hypothetical protein [Candidatus Omnitrophota bacterium]
MKFSDFKRNYQKYPLIFSKYIDSGKNELQNNRNQLNRWVKDDLIIRLKRGVYLLNERDRKVSPDVAYIANYLFEPSYVSLEYALSFYGLIPEETKDITSITTRKTMKIQNDLGTFVYQRIKPEAFRGFIKMGPFEAGFLMAEPEKALVDFLYLRSGEIQKDARPQLERSYRLQNLDELSKEKMMMFGRIFHSKKLMKVVHNVCLMINEGES